MKGRFGMSPEQLQHMVDLLPVARSFRDLGPMLGVSDRVIRREAKPFLELMKLDGTHPVCGCGKLRYHAGACVALNKEKWANTPGVLERREVILDLMREGHSYRTIGRIVGRDTSTLRGMKVHLSPDERAARDRIDAARNTRMKLMEQAA